jgi:guanine deaminase
MNGDPKRVFKGLLLNPLAPDRVDLYNPGYLVIKGTTILRVAREDPRPDFPDADFRDLGNKILLPGFVDTHVHLPQFAIMGVGQGELLAWLNTYTYPEEARFSDPEYAAKISKSFFDELVENGTTTAVIYSSIHERTTDIAFSTAQLKGVRAFIGKVMMDRNSPPALLENTEDAVRSSIRLFEKWDGADDGRLRYVFTPRFAGSCSMELMKHTGEVARETGAFVQSHLSENNGEIRWIAELFPEQRSYADVYDTAGLLGERTIMAHCVHLSAEEIALLARRRTKVAFCPYSNRNLRSGTMPYVKLRNAGLTISLGSDVAGGPSLSMFEQMREAINATGIAPAEALYLATLGGASALDLADHIGSFAPGKDADFIVASAEEYKTPGEALSALCLRGNKTCVAEVYIRGKLMYF